MSSRGFGFRLYAGFTLLAILACTWLLLRHRGRLRKMVDVYFDKRLRTRIDPSDVVQEALGRAVALDMESATIAANGFRFRVPYGTLLCVSDKPLHGQLKLPGMADKFYREQVDQHLKIGLMAMEKIRALGLTPPDEKLNRRFL